MKLIQYLYSQLWEVHDAILTQVSFDYLSATDLVVLMDYGVYLIGQWVRITKVITIVLKQH